MADLKDTTEAITQLKRETAELSGLALATGVILTQLLQSTAVDLETSTEKIRSDVEHVDLAEAISVLSNQQAVYQAALKATGMTLNQRTLMDFLG